MDTDRLRGLLEDLRDGRVSIEEVFNHLRALPYEDIGFARIDHHRPLRQGFPEVVFAGGKTPKQTSAILFRLAESNDRVLATHASPETADLVLADVPGTVYHHVSRCIVLDRRDDEPRVGKVVIVCAGTSDLPVAEEAAVTADLLGANVEQIVDAGVSGIHRILSELELLSEARAIVVVAGMEGALPSVVGGLVALPVIAVPTSVGYGASYGGLAALLAMLNSCAPGVSVVNIDNGFGGGYQAALINNLAESDQG